MIILKHFHLTTAKIDTLIVPVCKGKEIHEDQTVAALIKKAKQLREFTGEKEDFVVFYAPPEIDAKRVIFFGLGDPKNIDAEAVRSFAGKAIKHCIDKKLPVAHIAVPGGNILPEMSMTLEALMEGALLSNHLFDRYKKEKKQHPLTKIILIVKPALVKQYIPMVSRVTAVCRGTLLARQWVNTPPNDKRPAQLATAFSTEAKKAGLAVSVMDDRALRRNKFGALLAVAAGSRNKPRLVVLEYHPKGTKKTVALVGKGVTFDSGGINLKPTGSLKDMKLDMAGAAAVAATVIAAATLKPKIRIVGVIPIVENMVSGAATRPGDVVRSYDGKTIEIGNTDAEGRLILADAMTYAVRKYRPETLIDVATLTGACVVALGEKIAGVFSPDAALSDVVRQSGEKTFERCWPLPLPEDYKEMLKSNLADIRNLGATRWGGAIAAALFLAAFVGETQWAHIDIAGPAFLQQASAYCPAGATGFGVRLLCDLLEQL